MVSKRLFHLIGFSLVAACLSQGQDSSTARRAAAAALSSHQYNQALRYLEPLLKQHPHDPLLLTMRGVALDGVGRTPESLSSFDRALAIDPAYLPALKGAAQISYLRANPRALEYVKKLLVVMPTNDVGNAMAGALSYQAHDCAAVISYFTLSNDQVYRDPKALDEFADCLLKQEQNDEALRVLLRGTQLHPERADLTYNLAVAQLRTHQPAEAIKTLTPLSNSNDSDLLNLLASAYVQTNQPDDAFRVLEKAIELNPTDQTNYLDLAILCLEHNQENRTVKAATAGIARIPKAASLYLIRGVAYAQLAQYDQAQKDFTDAAQLEPDQPHSVVAMSMLYSDRNQPNKERELLMKQLAITPKDSVTNYLLADLIIRSGVQPGQPAFQEAKGYLATSLAAKPDSPEAQILMGHLLEQENNISDAISHYSKAIELEPNNRSALDRQFMLLRRLHRNDEADQILQRLKAVLNNELDQEKQSFSAHMSAAPHEQQ